MGWAVIPPCSYGRGNVGLLQTDLCQHTVAPQTAEVSFPWPRGRLLWTHASTGDSQTLQASLLQSLVRSLLLSPGSWYTQGFVSALKESVSQLSSGRSMVGLMATSSKRSYSIPRSPAPRAAASAAVHCRLMPCRRHSNIVLSQSLWGFWVLVYPRFVWATWAFLAGMGFDSKCNFASPTILLGLLLCLWIYLDIAR